MGTSIGGTIKFIVFSSEAVFEDADKKDVNWIEPYVITQYQDKEIKGVYSTSIDANGTDNRESLKEDMQIKKDEKSGVYKQALNQVFTVKSQ